MISTSELFAGHFQLGPLLGQGGMSDVYRAVDARSGAEVAVKIVRSGDPELAHRLSQEVRVQQRLSHEGLIALLDTGVAGGQAYLVMELIDGATLSASLRTEALGARLTAKLGTMLGAALDYIHGEGIVHRDVKPSNIMLSTDGRALLGDFGIARLLDATTFTIDGTTIGTIAYMAPEQLEDHQVGPPADIWSLGIVLLECLTGRRIYEGTSSKIVARRLAGPVPLPPDLPVPWKLLLSGMLDHRPEHRLTGEQVASMLSATAFTVPWAPAPISTGTRTVTQPLDLTALAPGVQFAPAAPDHTAVVPAATPVPAGAPPGPPPVFSRPKRRRWWPVAAIVAVLALVGAGVALAVDRTPTTPKTHIPPAKHPAASTSSTSTTTSTSSTTTTTVPTAPTALATLVQDITSGEDAGAVSSGTGQALTSQAQQAVTDEAHGQPQAAAQDLQQAAITIQSGEQSGALDPSEGSVLQNDLDTLAGTLGLSAAATVTTTTTTTTAPGPGGGGLFGGLGKHHGNGDD